ncbi:MAG: carbohydrate ABC transporter permease, partial [Anaerolineae bacterium]|nr:carbohydrate ABC transporter permease [Anaerolineae bacterium]
MSAEAYPISRKSPGSGGTRVWDNVRDLLVYTVLIVLAIAMIFPYYWMVVNTLKGPRGFNANPNSLIPKTLSFESIDYVLFSGKIIVYLKNSLLYASIVIVVQTTINAMAAYAFSRVEFPGREILFYAVLATMMLPYSVLLIPTYLIVWRLGLANTRSGVVIPAFASAYGIYMLRQFFLNIPFELEDAARIDGCSRFRIFWQIIIPLAQPALVTMGMFTFIGQWSSFTWPLIVLSDFKKYPITVGLSLFRDENTLYWDRTFAACMFATLPLILLFAIGQRFIVGG